MAPVRTKRIALVSTTIPNFKRHKGGGGGGGGVNSDIRLEPTATVSEGAEPGDVIATIVTVPAGADIELVDDAGGRFELDGTDLIAGQTPFDYETATQHTVVIRATAGAFAFDKPIVISVVNEVELTDIALSAATLAENSASGTIVGALSSTPTGATFGLLNNAGNRFAIVNGNLVAGSVATNFEAAASHQVEVQAVRGGETRTETFTITIGNVTEITGIALSANTTPEDSVAPTVIGALSSTPTGATWSLTNTAGGRFAISGNNVVRGATALDYDQNSSHLITVRGTRGGETRDQDFTINVTNVNGISNITLSAASVAENTAAGAAVGTLASVPAGATLTLTNNAGNRFALNGNALQTGATATNYEAATSHDIEVTATQGSDTLVRTFTVNVTDVDEISDISLSANTIGEGAAQNAVVGVLSSTPGGATWSLTNSATNRFAISGNNLVRGVAALDYETATSHQITVQGTRGGETFSKDFTINVTDVDEINDITLSNTDVAEDIGSGGVIGALASLPVAGATWSLTNNAGGRFALSGNNLVRGATALDYETDTSHSITVRGTRLNETFDKVFTINVSDVAELTDITLSNASISEGAAAQAVVGTLASDPTGAVYSMSSDAGGRFAINGNDLVRGATALDYEAFQSHSVDITATLNGATRTETFTISVTDVDEVNDITLTNTSVAENIAQGATVGTLASNPVGATFSMVNSDNNRFAISGSNLVRGVTALDYETATSHSITIRATRLGETYDEVFTISVTNVDELTGIALSANTVAESAGAGVTVGTLSSTPGGASYALTDNGGGRFALSGASVVTTATGFNYEAATSHDITVVATLGADSETRTFTINVTDVDEVNDIILSNATVSESIAQGATVGTLSSSPVGATFSMIDTANNRFTISGSTLVRGTTALDYDSQTSHSITIRATRLGETYDEVFTISVTNVDELTNITLSNATVAESLAQGGTVGTLTSTPGGASYTLSDDAQGRFALSGATVVRGTTALDADTQTSHQITVVGTLGADTETRSFTITVTNVDELTGIALSNNSTPENSTNGTVVGALTSTPAGASFTLTNNAGNRFAISGTNLVRGATALDYEAFQSHSVTVQATLGADTESQSFTINVSNVVELSSIALGSPASLTDGAANGTVIGTLSSSPTGATFSLPSTGSVYDVYFGALAINGSNQLVKNTAGPNPYPALPGFPLYDGSNRARATVRAARGGETLDQVMVFTPVKAANNTLTLTAAQQTATASSATTQRPYLQRELTAPGGPFNYVTYIHTALVGGARVTAEDYVEVVYGDTWMPLVQIKDGAPRPVTVEVYLYHAIADTGGQVGQQWSKTTLQWT